MKYVHLPRPSDYDSVYAQMQAFTATRESNTPDECWVVEHAPVYTLGQAGQMVHVLNPGNIPLIQTNRGGQVTYHGPGQVVLYPLLNLQRRRLFVREYVVLLEEAIIQTLAHYGITGQRIVGAPGVYVPYPTSANCTTLTLANSAKIAALGVKVSRGYSYHGLALNVSMDLRPFAGINPCGYAGLPTTDMASQGVHADWLDVANRLCATLDALLEAQIQALKGDIAV